MTNHPPARADQVGNLLRPQELTQGRATRTAGFEPLRFLLKGEKKTVE